MESDIYTDTTEWDSVNLSVQTDGSYRTNGTFYSDSSRRYAIITPVSYGDVFKLTTVTSSALIPAVSFYNNSTFVSYLKAGSGAQEIVTDYEFTIPDGVNKLIVQNATAYQGEFILYKKRLAKNINVYTKAEVNELLPVETKRYGVKWSTSDYNDEGARCFDSVGKSATIGIGSVNGSSDFDEIYPWSEIKRCNIKKTSSGAELVTFEGENGFALDGSNGDVFVRIPAFYYERYFADGYEYHVISDEGESLHPAFIENGKPLKEIFIGAFEGYIDSGKLKSVGGVIPSSNVIAQTFLSNAVANGLNYSLYDSRCVDAIWNLLAVEYGKRNTNRVLGYGYSNFEQPVTGGKHDIILAATNTNTVRTTLWTSSQKEYMPIGSNITICANSDQRNILTQAKITAVTDGADYTEWTFDGSPIDVDTTCFIGSAACTTNFVEDVNSGALTWHTGRANWIEGSNTRNPVRYRWIENLIGSLWHFLPDVSFNDFQMYMCQNMKDYEFGKITNPYTPVGALMALQTSNGSKADSADINYWITGLITDYFTKGLPFGAFFDTSMTSAKAFGGYYYLANGNRIVENGGGFDHLYRSNMLTNRIWENTAYKWYLYGARLMYKHVN